jgi:hypothetical protein
MRRSLLTAVVALGGALALSCTGDREPLPPTLPSFSQISPPVNRGQVQDLIPKLFPLGDSRQQATGRLNSIQQALLRGDMQGAQQQARDFVGFAGQLLSNGKLLIFNGVSPDPYLQSFVRALFAFVGITGLGQDGAVEVVGQGEKTIVTQPLGYAGVHIPADNSRPTFLLVISQLPNVPPLNTNLTQIPPFYEFSPNPPVSFAVGNEALAGLCQVPEGSGLPESEHFDRIRLAHAVPDGEGGFTTQVLAYAFPNFLMTTCGANPPPGGLGGVLRRLLLPQPLHAAAMSHGGVGGLITSFSPFAAVDIFSGGE